MTQDTIDFLGTLLWLASDDTAQPFAGMTVHDFAPEFQQGAERFLAAFRAWLEPRGYDSAKLAGLERSFGGNVYLSLSGHGAGFFDERDGELAALQGLAEEFAGGLSLRFHELESDLEVNEAGKIDLAIIPEAIDAQRAALFAVPAPSPAPAAQPAIESGAAGMRVELSGGTIKAWHSGDSACLLEVADVRAGTWDALWQLLEGCGRLVYRAKA